MDAGDPHLGDIQGEYGENVPGLRLDGLLKFPALLEWFVTVGCTSRLRLPVRKSTYKKNINLNKNLIKNS